MLPFNNLILPDKESRFPLYKQITSRLISLIQEGMIPPGAFFPGTRQMAGLLSVNRKTVISAYGELLTQEWIESVYRKGYRVIPELPVIKPRSFHPQNNFLPAPAKRNDNVLSGTTQQLCRKAKSSDIIVNDGFPDLELAPFKELSKVYRDDSVSPGIKQLMCLRDQGGLGLLKEAASLFLNETRGLHITSEDMVITRGAQMAIYIAASVLLSKGDNVVVCEPNYIYANEVIENTGANVIKIAVDDDGADIDQLEHILKTTRVKLLYIVPHHHHPTTATLSPARRHKLLQLIERHGFYVIEDDYDYDFHYENSPILPLACSNHNGRIIYIGSFTKLLAPSIRVGYLIAAPEIVKKAINLRRLIDLRGDTFVEYLLAQMIINGDLGRHIKKSNKVYARRCDFICDLLTRKLSYAVEFTKPLGGMAVWLKFRPEFPVKKVLRDASHFGLSMMGMSFYQPGNPHHNGLRFGFASLSEEQITKAVMILVKLTS
jgi:GntR family transcriptional regulator/MocR family aminotransferase